jgi:acyl-CoA oxidase
MKISLKIGHVNFIQDGIEECRKLCGGHGYLCSSGLPELYAAYLPACTYEGENVILFSEVSNFTECKK